MLCIRYNKIRSQRSTILLHRGWSGHCTRFARASVMNKKYINEYVRSPQKLVIVAEMATVLAKLVLANNSIS